MNKTIVLVGLMGCGKTTIGRRVAARLKIPFVDIDIEIERDQKCTISEYFEYLGEEKFRDLEKRTIARVLEGEPCVVATGGGAFMNPETQELIKNKAVSIWLKADLETLVERVSRKNTRPILEKGNKEEIMKNLMEKRYPIYIKADITVQSDGGSHNKVVNKIIQKLKNYG